MADRKSIFIGTVEQLSKVDIEAPLLSARNASCCFYCSAFGRASEDARKSGDPEAAACYAFLSVLTAFAANFDTPEQPYRQMLNGPKLSDLCPVDISAVEEMAPRAKDPALRARLFDLLWELKRDHKACEEAAKQYLLSAKKCASRTDSLTYADDNYRRALYLSSKLGRNKKLYKSIAASLVKTTKKIAGSKNMSCLPFLNLVLAFGCGVPSEFAEIAEQKAKQQEQEERFFQARLLWETTASFLKRTKEYEKEKQARLSMAQAYVTEAMKIAQDPSRGSLAAAYLLRPGIEALRRLSVPREQVDKLRKLLDTYQAAAVSEMQTIATEIDLSQSIRDARKVVRSKSFEDALFKFALGHPLLTFEMLQREVEEQAAVAPLTFLMGGDLLDKRGRPIASRGSLFTDDPVAREEAMSARVFNAAQFHWDIRSCGFIDPARIQISWDHPVTLENLTFAVLNNPVVPPGHEIFFHRGIYAGFQADFVMASHLLVPQIENSLRYVLEGNGISVTNLKSDGTEPGKMLGSLLTMHELEEIIGRDFCFELRGLLIEKHGYDFRNRLAHGYLTQGACHSSAAVNVWWLVLRLCLLPCYVSRRQKSARATEKPSQPADVVAKTPCH